MKNERVRYIRKNGRIIPIREKRTDQALIAAGSVGAAVSADAARTKTVYKSKSLTIEKKMFSIMPMDTLQSRYPKFGDALFAKNVQGKRVGRMHFTVEGKEGVIDWLSVKKSERGKGISKKLVKQAAIEMRAKGGKEIFTHVVHPRSAALLEGEKGVRSQYWRVARTTKKSGMFLEGIGKKEALAKAGQWKGKPGKFNVAEFLADSFKSWRMNNKQKYAAQYAGPTIYRQVKLPNTMRSSIKPFRSMKNKLALGLGAAVAVSSLAALYARRNKK